MARRDRLVCLRDSAAATFILLLQRNFRMVCSPKLFAAFLKIFTNTRYDFRGNIFQHVRNEIFCNREDTFAQMEFLFSPYVVLGHRFCYPGVDIHSVETPLIFEEVC